MPPEDKPAAQVTESEPVPIDDEFQDGMTWADDVPLMCGVENPDICESCQ